MESAERIKRIREYYFSEKLKEIGEMSRTGIPVINLGIGNPDRPPSPDTISELRESAADPGHHGYQGYQGILPLRKAFAGWYNRYFQVDLDPEEEILPLIGSKEGIFHISMAFLNDGDQVLIPDPGYPAYRAVSEMVGAEVIPYDLTGENKWFPDFDRLAGDDLSRVKLMWVNYPHMPSGRKPTRELFTELVRFGTACNLLIINDNPYSFILNDHPLSLLEPEGAREVALELNSLSKSHNMAGWRVGMVAGRGDHIRHILKVTSNLQSGMFLPLQHAAIKALDNPDSWYEELNGVYRDRRKVVWEILDLLGCRYDRDQGGLFVWAKIPGTADSIHFSDRILHMARVFITPGLIFGRNGTQFIRISLCSGDEQLEESKKRIMEIREAI